MFPKIDDVPGMEKTKDLITTEEIKFLFRYQRQICETNSEIEKKFLDGRKNQVIEEKKILSQMSICPIQKELSDQISSLNAKNIKNLVSNQYFNPKVMESVMCLTDTILYLSPDPRKNEHLRNWISKLKQFGDPSVSGYALIASLKGSPKRKSSPENIAEDIFVIKAPRNKKSNDELIHEAFVGMTSLNHLRNIIPNYTYIYGLFQCSGPIIDPETKEVIHWCHEKGDTNYLLMENISNAVSFKDFVVTSTLEDFVSLYLQTLYAIRTGYLKCDFTHYDLHSSNVLIRDIPTKVQNEDRNQKVAIPYDTENGREYWIGSKIATIIDYGRVHISHKGEKYGFWDYPEFYIYPDRSYLLYDAYKLLGFLLNKIKRKNSKIFEEASKILDFFNITEKKNDFINKNLNYYYSLPLTGKIAEKTLDDLLIYIRSIYDCSSFLSSDPQNYPVLSCQNDKLCLTQNGIMQEIEFGNDPKYLPNSVFELCDLIKKAQGSGGSRDSLEKDNLIEDDLIKKDNLIEDDLIENDNLIEDDLIENDLIKNFDFDEILFNTDHEFNQIVDSIHRNLDQLSIIKNPQLRDLEFKRMINEDILFDLYRSYIFQIAKTLSEIESLQEISTSYDCVINSYNHLIRYRQYSKIFKDQIDDFIYEIIPHLNIVLDGIDYVLSIEIKAAKLIKLLKKKGKPQIWFWETFPKFNYLENYRHHFDVK